jgi:hypothetical protein
VGGVSMTFHTFLGKYRKDQYYLAYNGEVTLTKAIKIITSSKPLPKLETPALVLNRFKTVRRYVDNGYVDTVYNRYANLERTTGWFGLDVDGCGPKTGLVKNLLCEKIQDLKVVWISSSGQGVKAIGYDKQLEDLTPKEFRLKYIFITAMIRHTAGMRINFDPAMSRCHQPIFLNSDPNAFVR